VTFRQTPEMSTYLVAFIVGDFEYVEDVDSRVRTSNPHSCVH